MKLKNEREKVIVCNKVLFNDNKNVAITLYKHKLNNKSLIYLLSVKNIFDYKNEGFTDSDLIDFISLKRLYYLEKYDKYSYFIDVDKLNIIGEYMGISLEDIELFKKKVALIRDIDKNKKMNGIDLKKGFYKYVKDDLRVLNHLGEELTSYNEYMKKNKHIYDSRDYSFFNPFK